MLTVFNFLFIGIPILYILFGKGASLTATGVFFIYFLIIKFANSKMQIFDIILKSKLYSKVRDISQNKLLGYLYTLGAIFIVVKFFQKDIACFSLLLSLTYLASNVLFARFSKVKLLSRPLDVMLILTLVLYLLTQYLGDYFGLEDNVLKYSIVALPLIHFSLRWPEEGFSVIFFMAFVAQFIKNSF